MLRSLLLLGLVAGVSGCFNPRVKNFGFACDVTQRDSCPNGFQCIDGYCDDGSGGRNPGAGVGGNAVPDLSSAPAASDDLARAPLADMSRAAPDLGQPVADMTQPIGPDMSKPMCHADGQSCTSYKDCCSGHCHSLTTLVCYTP